MIFNYLSKRGGAKDYQCEICSLRMNLHVNLIMESQKSSEQALLVAEKAF